MIIRHLFPAGWHHFCTCSQESQLIVSFKLAGSSFCFWLPPSFLSLLCPREDSVSATKLFVFFFFFKPSHCSDCTKPSKEMQPVVFLFLCVFLLFLPTNHCHYASDIHFPPCCTVGPDLASHVADTFHAA